MPADEREELKKLQNYIKEDRLIIIRGDIAKHEVIDDRQVLKTLSERVTEVWHLAGATDFDMAKMDMTFKLNIEGTSNILDLARQFHRLKAFYHYSTAYISHKGNGLVKIYEDCLPDCKPENTNNPYEESKLLGERIVAMSGLPFVVFRPSIVMGHFQSAEAESDKMVYGVIKNYLWLKWMIIKRAGYIPDEFKIKKLRLKGNPFATKNLITIDNVIEASLRAREKGDTHITYNLVNPIPTTLKMIHEAIFETINSDFLILDTSVKKEDMSRWERIINRGIGIYGPYMIENDPDWDMSNTLKIMNKSEFHTFDHKLQLHLYKSHVEKWLAPD